MQTSCLKSQRLYSVTKYLKPELEAASSHQQRQRALLLGRIDVYLHVFECKVTYTTTEQAGGENESDERKGAKLEVL